MKGELFEGLSKRGQTGWKARDAEGKKRARNDEGWREGGHK